MKVGELVQSLSDHCILQVEQKHILAISDTSEINLQSHVGRLKTEGIGVVSNNTDIGFYIHPTLILDAANGFPLGLSTLKLWTRDKAHVSKHERNYHKQPIEEKESYKWLRSASESQQCLSMGYAKTITHIGDRESDLFEEFATVADKHNHLLIRSRQDRRLLGNSNGLYGELNKQSCSGTYTVDVPADTRIDRKARVAFIAVRHTVVKIQRPDKLNTRDYPSSITVYAVEARLD